MAVFLGRLAAIRTNQPGPGESSTNQTEGAGSPKVFLKEGFGGETEPSKKSGGEVIRFLLG